MPETISSAPESGPPFRNWAESFWRLFFPPRCLTCGVLLPPLPDVPLCPACRGVFAPAGQLCPRCGQLAGLRQPCGCSLEAIPLQGLFALSWYEGPWRRMLHRFKFGGGRGLARPLGRWLGESIAEQTGWNPHLAVPVPLHRQRLAQRGYNQAFLLARFTAQVLQIPLCSLLVKVKAGPPQSGLSYRRRQENIRGAFAFRAAPLRGKRVLLVDDIYSTGATMHEAAKVLHEQGLIVFGAAAAFTPRLN